MGESPMSRAAVLALFQPQRQFAHLEFGQGAAEQQARIHRHQQFGAADLEAAALAADTQVVEDETRAAPGPLARLQHSGESVRL